MDTKDKELLAVGKVNQFDSVLDFVSYANAHYLPLIKDLRDNEALDPKERKLLGFMVDDFGSLLNELEKSYDD